MGVPVDVMVNDQRAGSIWRGESTAADLPAGPVAVSVSAWSAPGRSLVRLPAVAGGNYTLEVAPRTSSVAPAVFLGLAGAALDAAAAGEQGGPFTLRVISAQPPIGTAPAPSAASPPSSTATDREGRLTELRSLRARGLITEEVYREEQRRILAPLTGASGR
jgi:hypothetical protein